MSVISFVGLHRRRAAAELRQPAADGAVRLDQAAPGRRPAAGRAVRDGRGADARPVAGTTACTQSTLALASQARKYGLGLVFATQAPKGLHNRIPGNATTQFFGLLNAPAQIDAARGLAQAKGGHLPDIGLLGSGEFYAAGEGFSFVKVRTPLCLSHHPKAPLTPEEVIARARGQRGSAT